MSKEQRKLLGYTLKIPNEFLELNDAINNLIPQI